MEILYCVHKAIESHLNTTFTLKLHDEIFPTTKAASYFLDA